MTYKFVKDDQVKFQDTLDHAKDLEDLGWECEDGDEKLNERELLKKEADELGIEYPNNIPTAKLAELVKEAE